MSSFRAIDPEACTFPTRNIHSVFRRLRAKHLRAIAYHTRCPIDGRFARQRTSRIAVPGCNTGQHTCRLVAFFGLRHFLVRSRLRFSLKRHNRQSPRRLPSLLRQNPRIPPHRPPSSTKSISTPQRQRNSIRSRKLAPPPPTPLPPPDSTPSSTTATISLPAR